MAFRCESQLKYFFPVPIQSLSYYPLPSFSQVARNFPLISMGKILSELNAEAPYNFNYFNSSISESSGFTIPDPFLIKKIVSQIEFYFSDDNLSKDLFLLRHIQRNKLGYVSIKLLTTLKKMKRLTWNWRVTLYALQFSKLLELSEDGTKVRRKEPIPESFVNIPFNKTLLAWNVLPCEESDSSSLLIQENFLDTISKLFGPFGDIACIRIFRPGKKLPSAVKKATSSYPELLIRWCALVEYERLKSARKAFEGLIHKQFCSPGQSIKVINLSTLKKMNVVSQEDNEKIEEIPMLFGKWANKLSEGIEDSLPCSSSTEPDSIPVSSANVPQNCFSPPGRCTTKPYNSSGQAFKSNSSSISHAEPLQLRKALSGSPFPSPISAPKSGTSELQKPSNTSWGNRLGPENLGTQKRHGPHNNQSDVQNPESLGPRPRSTIFCKPAVVCPTVIRLPRGPDGTKGFLNTRERGRGRGRGVAPLKQ
ncbi:la-related protein 6-like [Pantherophis guttatus]|uniref:La-related protein 6-like n=1 Tax=Pantherophis guttatus TaxID=94885 RepID=A0A6P9BXQ1_PANGU|nr:la-related protein 6-like [Pantherophis guttatus]